MTNYKNLDKQRVGKVSTENFTLCIFENMILFCQIAPLCDKQVKLQLQIILPSFSHAVNKSYSESSARSEFLNNTYQRNNLSKPVTYIGFDLLGDVKDELHNNTFEKKYQNVYFPPTLSAHNVFVNVMSVSCVIF